MISNTTESNSYHNVKSINRMKEPARTRARFYLDVLNSQKQGGEQITQRDIDISMGRACNDGFEDQAVSFDMLEVLERVKSLETGTSVKRLRDIIDGFSG